VRYCLNKKLVGELNLATDFLRMMADNNRLKILCLLKNGEKCVCEIWRDLEIPQNLTSHHLKVLKDFGIINSHKEGLKIYYSLNKKEIDRYNKLINNLFRGIK